MKSKLISSIVLGSLLTLSSFQPTVNAATADDSNTKEKFRVYIQTIDKKEKANAKEKYGVRWELDEKTFSTTVNQNQYEALKKNKNITINKVSEVHVDLIDLRPSAAAPTDQTPWGIEAMYEDANITATSGGKDVRVAVLDTGAKKDHQDLASRVEQCKDFTGFLFPLRNGSCSDLNGHGTHVAGTVLADGGSNKTGIYGVAPEASLWAYKVLGNTGSGFSDDIAYAIRHAADEGKRLGVKTIISMSLGSSGKDTLITDAVKYANANGALVVAAAGNSGPNENTIGYPGALPEAIAVAALENTFENGTYRVADFSSRGVKATAGDFSITEKDVELSAPGRNILSTWIDGGYNSISGTSMATPHVSGLAAKIWAQNPSLSAQQLRTELQNRAKANDINGGLHAAAGDDIASGFGFPTVK
ncbi:S8 family peptidase [Mangrovibacillus cuniculi]|uniref:S8 family peptidase n=1 Tax=Mangrovibacillus cuniculi TaxID=2593652 RepID=A0A7S8C9E2_9BACI|nr:S8 family peptidase [Mangrovibacillus cuniculi]QPC45658.1 S8 family peptidase [Mangrovibacillus cuniculi]